jgi:predicted amidophosphoribosyltransferase
MILHPPNHNKIKEVLYLYEYHPYKLPDGSKNPAFNENRTDSLILDVKLDRKAAAIAHFVKVLDGLASADIVVAVVPGHDPAKKELSGIAIIAQCVAAVNERVDGTGLLVRHTKIKKLATGGDRAIAVHLNSIRVAGRRRGLAGASVLLLDDVATSENSLHACKQLLLAAGAGQVQMFALSKTVR